MPPGPVVVFRSKVLRRVFINSTPSTRFATFSSSLPVTPGFQAHPTRDVCVPSACYTFAQSSFKEIQIQWQIRFLYHVIQSLMRIVGWIACFYSVFFFFLMRLHDCAIYFWRYIVVHSTRKFQTHVVSWKLEAFDEYSSYVSSFCQWLISLIVPDLEELLVWN